MSEWMMEKLRRSNEALAFEIDQKSAEIKRLRADRRERIATAAMQGLLSNPATSVSPWEIVVAATVYADALIAKLDEEKGKP